MKREFEKLMQYAGTKKFEAVLEQFYQKYKDVPGAKKQIADWIKSGLTESAKRIDNLEKEVNLRLQLSEISEVISIAYIAKNYFNKSRAWLHQRIKGNIVNGKAARFTDNEMDTLNFALQDISKRIASLHLVR